MCLFPLGLIMLLSSSPLQRVYYEGNQYLVNVRHGQWFDIRNFVQPLDPDVLAISSRFGYSPWKLYDFVCRNVNYRRDTGEFWQTPSETLEGYGDCEDTSILLTSLIKTGGVPACYVALGSMGGYGHAWCQLGGQILETTFTQARPVTDPHNYIPFVLFDNLTVIEIWPGALAELFKVRRDESAKLNLLARALEV